VELHEKIKDDAQLQQKLSEHIKQKALEKIHEKIKTINPEALEKMKTKLSAHLEKHSAGLSVNELHEKLKDDVELREKLSQHIKEKMSEKIANRNAASEDSRAISDCTNSISDVSNQSQLWVSVK